MKNFKIIVFALFTVLTLTGCDPNPDPITPETYWQSVTLDAQGTEQTVTLTDLKSKIDNVENSNTDWLMVRQSTYTSGSPSVKVKAEANPKEQPRIATVIITAVNNDQLTLTVTQAAKEAQNNGIEDPHDQESDQPAYSRQR